MKVSECLKPDDGDRITIGRAGNIQRSGISGIACYGDNAVVGREAELGLHRAG